MSGGWLTFLAWLPRYSDRFIPLIEYDIPNEGTELDAQWLRAQCNFRGLESSGTFRQIKARLDASAADQERASRLQSFHKDSESHHWREDAFRIGLDRVLLDLEDKKAPVAIKVQSGNRLAALRACAFMDLAHKCVKQPADAKDQGRWIVIGKDPARVRDKTAEIEHRIDTDEDRGSGRAMIKAENLREDIIKREADLSVADPYDRPLQEMFGLAAALAQVPNASLPELKNMKREHFMHGNEMLDPDVDAWIPEDPTSPRLGLIRTRISERTKLYWEAQCFLRGLPSGGHIIAMQGRLRNRSEAIEERTAQLIELCEAVLDAEWKFLHPLTRFNVRSVRKARKIMLHPEENAIARNWLTSRDIRPETLERLRAARHAAED